MNRRHSRRVCAAPAVDRAWWAQKSPFGSPSRCSLEFFQSTFCRPFVWSATSAPFRCPSSAPYFLFMLLVFVLSRFCVGGPPAVRLAYLGFWSVRAAWLPFPDPGQAETHESNTSEARQASIDAHPIEEPTRERLPPLSQVSVSQAQGTFERIYCFISPPVGCSERSRSILSGASRPPPTFPPLPLPNRAPPRVSGRLSRRRRGKNPDTTHTHPKTQYRWRLRLGAIEGVLPRPVQGGDVVRRRGHGRRDGRGGVLLPRPRAGRGGPRD